MKKLIMLLFAICLIFLFSNLKTSSQPVEPMPYHGVPMHMTDGLRHCWQLYNANCIGCHGVRGEGIDGSGPNIEGMHARHIRYAIRVVPQMQDLKISKARTKKIARYLRYPF